MEIVRERERETHTFKEGLDVTNPPKQKNIRLPPAACDWESNSRVSIKIAIIDRLNQLLCYLDYLLFASWREGEGERERERGRERGTLKQCKADPDGH